MNNMPELAEIKIMNDYINQTCKGLIFHSIHEVNKSIPTLYNVSSSYGIYNNFTIFATSFGKELSLTLNQGENSFNISLFMGMSGNVITLPTNKWDNIKFVRLRFDSINGQSLLIYGGYMGPKHKFYDKFKGVKRGPDSTIDFKLFKENILNNLSDKTFNDPICDALLNQQYFNGIGNYLRSSIIYYLNINPFETARDSIKNNPKLLDYCKSIPLRAYELNGGQLKDWKNPFNTDSKEFLEWVYYNKGISCKDKTGRRFWFNPIWINECPYKII